MSVINKFIILFFISTPSLGAFDIYRPNFLTLNDLKDGYFYNSKSRAPRMTQSYWLCSERKKAKILDVSCAPLDDDDVDGSKRGFVYVSLKINKKTHHITPRNGSPRKDCLCQAQFIKRIISAPTFCFLLQDLDINERHFFQKETSWVFEKAKSANGTVVWQQYCDEPIK